MSIFLFILINNILPVFTLIGIGYLLSKKFNLDIFTLTKLNFYIFVPSFTLVNLYTTDIPLEMLNVGIFVILMLLANGLMAMLVSRVFGYEEDLKNAFANAIMFFNAGNIGIPLVTLIFGSGVFVVNGETPYLNIAITTQIIIMVLQNLGIYSWGFLNAGKAMLHWKKSLMKIFKMPTIYAMPVAFTMKLIPYDFTSLPIWPVLEYSRGALVPISLLALGVQLTRTSFQLRNKDVYIANAIRLLVAPFLAVILIYFLDFDGVIAQVLMISSALPTAVNCAMIAIEYDNCPNFSSQTVMTSTLFSGISLVLVIYAANLLFPAVG